MPGRRGAHGPGLLAPHPRLPPARRVATKHAWLVGPVTKIQHVLLTLVLLPSPRGGPTASRPASAGYAFITTISLALLVGCGRANEGARCDAGLFGLHARFRLC